MKGNPFGDELRPARRPANPFGDDDLPESSGDQRARIEEAARRIRGLRSQMGAEGLTLNATRELVGEIAAALDAIARSLKKLEEG